MSEPRTKGDSCGKKCANSIVTNYMLKTIVAKYMNTSNAVAFVGRFLFTGNVKM